MKTKYYVSLLVVTSLLNISCKEEVETAEIEPSAPKEIIIPRVQALPLETAPNSTQVPVQTTPNAPQAMPQPVTVAKGMNPAHGQPGHRCDIAVGVPLNSPKGTGMTNPVAPAAAKAPYTITQTPASTPATPATPTAPGMNPPHGQEGHRCDIAVGAALPKS